MLVLACRSFLPSPRLGSPFPFSWESGTFLGLALTLDRSVPFSRVLQRSFLANFTTPPCIIYVSLFTMSLGSTTSTIFANSFTTIELGFNDYNNDSEQLLLSIYPFYLSSRCRSVQQLQQSLQTHLLSSRCHSVQQLSLFTMSLGSTTTTIFANSFALFTMSLGSTTTTMFANSFTTIELGFNDYNNDPVSTTTTTTRNVNMMMTNTCPTSLTTVTRRRAVLQ